MPMPIHIRNPDGMPYQIQSVVTPSRKLSPEDLYKAGAITAKEYLSRTGRLQPADGLASALMPRTAAADDAGTLQQLLAGVSDVASLPGRAYASLGRPAGEPYQSALARLAATQGEGGADRFSEGVLRDPANILAPIGLSALSKIPAVARGLVAAGRYGSLAADVGANTAAQAVANKAIGEDAGVPQSAALNLAFGLGAHGLSGLARSGMRMISPEERAANFKNWFGDSKVVDEAGKPLVVYHGTDKNFDVFDPEKLGSLTGAESAKKGFFFTNNPENADFYAGWTPSKEGYDYVSDLVKRKESAVRSIQDEFEKMRRANRRIRHVDEDSFLSDDQLVAAGYAKEDIPQLRKEWVYSPEEMAVYNQRKDLNERLAEEESALDVARTLAVSNSIGRDFSSGVTPNVMPVNLALKNPLIHQQAGDFRDITFSDLLDRAKSSGNDGVIIRGTRDPLRGDVFVALDPTQIKSATGNRGTFDPTDPNITHFAGGPAYPQSLASIAASRIVNSGKQAAAMKAQEQ